MLYIHASHVLRMHYLHDTCRVHYLYAHTIYYSSHVITSYSEDLICYTYVLAMCYLYTILAC